MPYGKGVPLEQCCIGAVCINPLSVPTSQAVVQMYQENLTTERSFRIDPLEQQPAKKDARETELNKHFPTFDVIYQAIANTNDEYFSNVIFYYIELTKYPSRQ
ncbi:hypothetical protein ACROYT_G013882 [Oculina patagonica]